MVECMPIGKKEKDMKIPFVNKEKEEDIKAIRPNTLGWLEKKLSDQEMDYLWRCIENKKENYKRNLCGVVNTSAASNLLLDRSDWFFHNTIKTLCYQYEKEFANLGSRIPTFTSHPYVLADMWVNYQKQHEFIALHNHGGVYSFVIWMKIPTYSSQQRKNPMAFDPGGRMAHAYISNFEFEYINIVGELNGHIYEMNPNLEGTMLFFPSRLKHMVYPFYNCDETRISISGNISLNTSKKL